MAQNILELLRTVWFPREIVMVHYKGHQKGEDVKQLGNNKADSEAKANSVSSDTVLLTTDPWEPDGKSVYTSWEEQWMEKEGARRLERKTPRQMSFCVCLVEPQLI